MNTLINEIGQSGKFDVSPSNETHWTFDWYRPIKSTNRTNNNSSGINNIHSLNDFIFGSKEHNRSKTNLYKSNSNISLADNIIQHQQQNSGSSMDGDGDGHTVEKYPFKLKTWLKSTKNDFEIYDHEENNTLKVLDLNKFDRTQRSIDDNDQKRIALEKNKRIREDGLTEKDIRGAVTNVGSIPGLSSSTNNSTETTAKNGTTSGTNVDNSNKTTDASATNNKTEEQAISNDEKTETSTQTSDIVSNVNQNSESSDDTKTTIDNSTNTDKDGDIEMK